MKRRFVQLTRKNGQVVSLRLANALFIKPGEPGFVIIEWGATKDAEQQSATDFVRGSVGGINADLGWPMLQGQNGRGFIAVNPDRVWRLLPRDAGTRVDSQGQWEDVAEPPASVANLIESWRALV